MKRGSDIEERLELLRYNQHILFRWIRKYQAGKPLDDFFKENRLKRVAFYYWNEISELLYYEFRESDIHVIGVIDNRVELRVPLTRYSSAKELPEIDAIVICTAKDVIRIEEILRKQKKCLILSMNDLL